MTLQLERNELRVLGVLIEKSLAQQASYPMTLNAIQLGANQKQNRDPVLELTEGDVGAAVHELEQQQLVAQVTPATGARANRFEHRVVECLGWDRKAQAVMAELVLRGPQTLGELRARAGRMTSFVDLRAVGELLRDLMASDPPVIEELPREPGRSANRYRHLVGANSAAFAEKKSAPMATEHELDHVSRLETSLAQLTLRVAALEEQMARARGGGD